MGTNILQTFAWGEPQHSDAVEQRRYYANFRLQDTIYAVGDAAYVYPEAEGGNLYVGSIQKAFQDLRPGVAEPNCIEVGGVTYTSHAPISDLR